MKTVRKASPARSQGAGPRTPIRHKQLRSRSVSSARSNASCRLATLVQQHKNMDSFVMSPLASRRSILSDNTEIGEPRRKSWWKNLGENSRDVIELLEENNIVEPNNIIEELDIEVLSQEKKNFTMDLPESSDSESINSIVIPQRRLFTQKENLPHKKFGEIIGTRETLAKLHKPSSNCDDKTVNVVARELFQNKQRSKPIFPAALLNISPNKTAADKTKDFATLEPKAQVRNIFGNRAPKRKNIFTNFIVSDSEDEIPEIQPKVFGFQKKMDARRRGSSSSRGMREPSPASSITTDIEMDDWKLLPSSTMVENQLEVTVVEGMSPKRIRLSKLTEIESEAGSNDTKQSDKSISSKGTEKSRKSKTFTKEKAPVSDLVIENKSKDIQSEDEQIFEPNEEASDKLRKSKTFTKEKARLSDSMTRRNQSKDYQKHTEEMVDQNESSKDKDKSRKSKIFTKEKIADLSSMTNTNKSITSGNEDEVLLQNQIAPDRSKPTITDQNTSQSSIQTRSQSKSNSPNCSKSHHEEPITEDTDETITKKNKSKIIAISTKSQNIESEKIPLISSQENDDDDELNFTLTYENDDDENEEMPETLQNESQRSTRKSKTQQEKPVNVSMSKKNLSHKVNEESAEFESNHEKSSRPMKVTDNERIEVNHELIGHSHHGFNHSNSNNYAIEMVVDKDKASSSQLQQETVENQSEDMHNKSHVNIIKLVDHTDENNDESVLQNNQESEPEKNGNIGVDMNDSEQQSESEVEKSQEREEKNDETSGAEDQNKSQEIENASDNDEKQQQSLEVQNESEVNESQEIEDDVDGNNTSQEVEDEIEEEQNESQEEQNESQEEPQNESDVDQNESDVEEQYESAAIANSDSEHDEANYSQEDVNNSDTEESDHVDNDGSQDDHEKTETPNVSHDTTGRNRKKNESPEVILHDSKNQLDSFTVQGRNTSVRKTEFIKTLHVRPSLEAVRDSNEFSDGSGTSNAEGSGWDSHRTTRKTLRQTYGRDFTPRKSLRALVMEKSAKRQTQHNEVGSVTFKFPQANSTELPETTNRFEDDVHEVDENQVSNHQVSLRTRQATLEMYLQKVKKKNAESRHKLEEAVQKSLNAPSKYHVFKVPARPMVARKTTKPKQTKSTLFFGQLPAEVIEDFNYKPPKRFQPSNAPWITKRLYKFLESKLEAKYDYKARIRAEKLVESMYHFAKDLRRHNVASSDAVDVLKREMARLGIVKTHFEFYEFFHQFMPREVRVKVNPDVVNKISLPRHGVFSDIL